jgi:hypothetical protein
MHWRWTKNVCSSPKLVCQCEGVYSAGQHFWLPTQYGKLWLQKGGAEIADCNEMVVQAVSVIKKIWLDKSIFSQMWADIGSDKMHLVYHSDVSWQSWENAFQRATKLVNDVKINVSEAVELQVHIKGSYLSDTTAEINRFNNSIHGSYHRVTELTEKLTAFKGQTKLR